MKTLASQSREMNSTQLRRMKAIATGLLLLMALVFCLSTYFLSVHPSLGYVQAFAEAAMIGALADWFAVTALFRHPLGVPVPHTAIIPRRKNDIGDSLARFVDENFLTVDAVSPRLKQINFADNISHWLKQPGNAQRISSDCRAMISWLLRTNDDKALRSFLRSNFNLQLRKIEITPLLARLLGLLTQQNYHQSLVDEFIVLLRTKLSENKDLLRTKVEEESPWWLPEFIDEKIYETLIQHLDGLLTRVDDDGDHAVRKEFDVLVARTIEQFKNDPETIIRGEKIKEELLGHPTVQRYLENIGNLLQGYLEEQANNPDSGLSKKIEEGVARFSEELLKQPNIQRQINEWLYGLILHVVNNYSRGITSVISDTIRAWNPELTAQRIELSIGRDLQFIRVSGTLVGGLVGLLLHTIIML